MMRLFVVSLVLIAVGISLTGGGSVSAKGSGPWPQTFRISGGGLPHPVLVVPTDTLLATAVSGAWYDEPSGLPEPPSESTRFQIEIVDPNHDAEPIEPPKPYVIGPPARIGAQDGPGWGQPTPAIAALLNRYILLDAAGRLSERPTFAQVMQASAKAFGASATINGNPTDVAIADRLLTQIGDMTPSLFGVRGTLIGSRNLHQVQIDLMFGDGFAGDRLEMAYIPPESIAPYGLLMARRAAGNWGYIQWLDPPGYFATVYAVTPEFDAMMAGLGFVGAPEGDIVSTRLVALDRARQTFGIERYELSNATGQHAVVVPPEEPDIPPRCSDDACTRWLPQPPFTGRSMNGEVWPLPVDPFPEAVRPGKFVYYPHDALGSDRGVIVLSQGSAQLDGSNGREDPYFASPALDAVFKQQMARFADRSSDHRLAKTLGAGIPAGLAGVLALAYVSWSTERRRRRTLAG